MHFQALSCNGRLPKGCKIRYLASTDGAHNAGVEGSSPSLSNKSIKYLSAKRVVLVPSESRSKSKASPIGDSLTDRIVEQGPGYTIAISDVAGTLVPYLPAPRPDGSSNHGWTDLRGRPDLVNQIPEAARSAALSRILTVIADPHRRL